MGLAFFDIDKTILSVNSASLWIKRETRLGYLRKRDAARGAFWLGLYRLGFANIESAMLEAASLCEGLIEEEIVERNDLFWQEEIAHTIRPGARRAIQMHRERGDMIYALTSSSNYLADCVVRDLSLDGALSNRLTVSEGRFVGTFEMPLCYGPGKVVYANQIAKGVQESLTDAAFYTDSFSDVPMLRAVGEPVIVDPDARLKRLALKEGWPIVDWDL